MIRGHLVLFVRLPRYGVGKRRLAREIGDAAAVRFERTMLALLLRRLGRDRRWHLRLAVTPNEARHGRGLWRGRLIVTGQGRGDLGTRMRRALAACPAGPAVLVGSDIPGMTAAHIATAFRLLGEHDLVFGPAEDGGFWLVGTRRSTSLPPLFGPVRWSTRHALADVLRNLPLHLSVGVAARLSDVDDAQSWCRLRPRHGFRGT